MIPWVKSNPDQSNAREALGVWQKINSVLGIQAVEGSGSEQEDETLALAQKLCDEMNQARKVKDWDTADSRRQQILDMGFKVNQSKEGATIEKQLG